jgi:hypothetical protein
MQQNEASKVVVDAAERLQKQLAKLDDENRAARQHIINDIRRAVRKPSWITRVADWINGR